MAGAVENLVTKAFGGMEDALVNFVTTGKLDFKSLADSIIKDMIRIAIQQSFTGVLAKAFGSWIGGIGGAAAGASAGSSLGGGMTSATFSTGGYTGDGGRFEPAGIVHKGEGVLNQDEIRMMGGEAGFNAFRRAIRSPGHAIGGMAGRPVPPPAESPLRAGAGGVNVIVNITGNGAPEVKAPTGLQQFAKEIGELVETKYRELEIKSHRQGGISWQARQGAFA